MYFTDRRQLLGLCSLACIAALTQAEPLVNTPGPLAAPSPVILERGKFKSQNPSIAAQVVELVNQERISRSLPPLSINTNLTTAAEGHSEAMAVRNFVSHCDPDTGTSASQRVTNAGYNWSRTGENIAWGFSTPSSVMTAWMNSSGHRANILSSNYREIGVAMFLQSGDQANVRENANSSCVHSVTNGGPYGRYWTQNFGARSNVYPVIINGEQIETNDNNVDLYIYGQGWATEMRLRNDNGSFGAWQTFQPTLNWPLNPVDGQRSVTVEIRNSSGTVLTASDTISLTGQTGGGTADLALAAVNANRNEGNSGTTGFSFQVTRSVDTSAAVSANWAVSGSGANPANASDFGGTLPSGTVNLASGITTANITVNVSGDTTVEPNEGFTVTLSNPSNATISTATASGSIVNDDTPPPPAGFSVTPTSVSVAESGSTRTFSVVLTGQPASTVGFSISSSDTGEATVAPTSLSFTTSNWNSPQTVTVTGVDDAIVDGTQNPTVTVTVSSGPSSYTALADQTVAVSVSDDDTPPPPAGFSVTPTSVSVNESGSTRTFTVVLTGQPASTVGFSISSSDTGEATVAPTSLSFTTSNWNSPQTVTVTGVDDAIVDGTQNPTITVDVSSGPTSYTALANQTVSVSVADNDSPPPAASFTVSPTSGLGVSETGTTASFSVVLDNEPASTVNFDLSSSDIGEVTFSPATLSFSPSDWMMAQPVTLTGVDDSLTDGNQTVTISVTVASGSDADFAGLAAQTVSVSNSDDDTNAGTGGITVTPSSGLSVSEDGGSTSFDVMLDTQPSADVTLNLHSSNPAEGSVSPTSLSFTDTTWMMAQTVTVTGVDDAVVDGDVSFTVVIDPAVSVDSNYNGLDAADVSVINVDNDAVTGAVAGFTVSLPDNWTVDGISTSADFTVVLDAPPTGQVVLQLTSSDPTTATVSPTTLVFDATNWDQPQTVSVIMTSTLPPPSVTLSVDTTQSDAAYADTPAQTLVIAPGGMVPMAIPTLSHLSMLLLAGLMLLRVRFSKRQI